MSERRRAEPVADLEVARARLRERAESSLQHGFSRAAALPAAETLGHEVEVHRVELEIQNEELREAQERLEVSLQRYRELFDLSPVAQLVLAGPGAVVEANAAAVALLGTTSAALQGRSLMAFMTEEDASSFHLHLRAARGSPGQRQRCRLRLQPRGAGQAPVDVRAETVITRGSGECRCALLDLREEMGLVDELRHAQKMTTVGALASGLAHDFNNVLQAILGCVRAAQSERTSPSEAQAQLERAASAARRGGEVSRRLMAFSRQRSSERKPLMLDACVRELAALLEPLVTERVRLQLEAGAADRAILADAGELELALMNLAANARDAMPEGGTLGIRTEPVELETSVASTHAGASRAPYVCITVWDTGTGMDAATKERVFDPFFTTKEPGHGTGLGLASVVGVTRQLGGHVEVESEPGQGTTFRLYIPAHVRRASTEAPPALGEHHRWSGSVLLVEDDEDVRAGLCFHLERVGFEVHQATSEAQAASMLDAGVPCDLLISDVLLPGPPGGWTTSDRSTHPRVPLFFITADPHWQSSDPEVAVLRKPFDTADLDAALVRALGPPRAAEVPPPVLGAPLPPARPPPSRADILEAKTILLVEDDATTRSALGDLLEDEGYRVLRADGPAAALEVAERRQRSFDLLLSDVRLPRMRGPELAARLRQTQPRLPVVYLSGEVEGPKDGDAVLHKPVEFDALAAAIADVLARE